MVRLKDYTELWLERNKKQDQKGGQYGWSDHNEPGLIGSSW